MLIPLLPLRKGKNKNQGKKKNQDKKTEDSSASSKDETYSYCKKTGHPESKCYKKKRDEDKKKKETASSSSSTAIVASTAREGMYVSTEGHSAYVTSESRTWLLDSGATSHMTNRRDWFSSFTDRTGEITIGDGSTIPIRGSGTISIFHTSLDMRYFSNVLYVPDLSFNLLSVSSLTKQGASVEFLADRVTIRDNASGTSLASSQQDGGLYKFMALVSHTVDDALWHARFGHLSYSTLQSTHKDGLVDGLPTIGAQCVSLVFAASKPDFLFHRKLLTVHQNHLSLFILTCVVLCPLSL